MSHPVTTTSHVLTQYVRVTRILTNYAGAHVSTAEIERIAGSLLDTELGAALTIVHAWLLDRRRGRGSVTEADVRVGHATLESCLTGLERINANTLLLLHPSSRAVVQALAKIEAKSERRSGRGRGLTRASEHPHRRVGRDRDRDRADRVQPRYSEASRPM